MTITPTEQASRLQLLEWMIYRVQVLQAHPEACTYAQERDDLCKHGKRLGKALEAERAKETA